MAVGLVDLGYVWVVNYDVGEELEVEQAAGETLWELFTCETSAF